MALSRWIHRGIAALVGAATLVASVAALAEAPQVKTQPGYYRLMVGEIEVTALSDGAVGLPVDTLLTNTTKAAVAGALARDHLQEPVETSVNAYLINTGKELILIDAGAGTLFGPTLGKLAASLKAAGYQPEQVDEIFITHLHPDHVGGLVADGKRVFTNATVRADQRDIDFWLSKDNLDKADAQMKDFFQGAQVSLLPYVAAGKFLPFSGNGDLASGVKVVEAPGHTPGHSIYVVESQGQKLVLWGDLMHVAAVQFAQPSVTIAFDTDSKSAAARRKRAYADAAKGGYLIGAAHLSFPGIGRVRKEGNGYRFLPVNYSAPN